MAWRPLNACVRMWEEPALGSIRQDDGRRYMALCIGSKSKGPFRGIARQIIDRQGSPDIPGFMDKSKLIIVESHDLLHWNIVCDLHLQGFEGMLHDLSDDMQEEKKFIGLEDPDIITDEDGTLHLFFTIPFRYKRMDRHDLFVGHAQGAHLESLVTTPPVLTKVDDEIEGFKEICPAPVAEDASRLMLAETAVNKGKTTYSAISVSRAKSLSGAWNYERLIHDPQKESRRWCAGFSSPCRIFDARVLHHGKYLVGIMNGRELTKVRKGKKYYGRFCPGLFLFDNGTGEIVWIDDEPLFEDPDATTITFASELVCQDKEEAILYAHPNDSFIRAYKLDISQIRKRLPNLEP